MNKGKVADGAVGRGLKSLKVKRRLASRARAHNQKRKTKHQCSRSTYVGSREMGIARGGGEDAGVCLCHRKKGGMSNITVPHLPHYSTDHSHADDVFDSSNAPHN